MCVYSYFTFSNKKFQLLLFENFEFTLNFEYRTDIVLTNYFSIKQKFCEEKMPKQLREKGESSSEKNMIYDTFHKQHSFNTNILWK